MSNVNPMNLKYLQIAVACLILSIILSVTGVICVSKATYKWVDAGYKLSEAKKRANAQPKIFAPSIETKSFAGFLTGTRSIAGGWAIDTDMMHFVVEGRPEVCTRGDSVVICEYGMDGQRYARILPYQKRYKIKERN